MISTFNHEIKQKMSINVDKNVDKNVDIKFVNVAL